MTHQQWKASLAPKVAGTWNLHEVLPRDIDFFVALSSVAGISGHAAQVNYTSACTFQDAFMQYRRNQGQSGFAIDVGVVGDVTPGVIVHPLLDFAGLGIDNQPHAVQVIADKRKPRKGLLNGGFPKLKIALSPFLFHSDPSDWFVAARNV